MEDKKTVEPALSNKRIKAETEKAADNMWSDKFLQFLNEIEPLGTFATFGNVEIWQPFFPRVTLPSIGRLSFPLMDMAVEPIKAQAALAPFGRGAETLYDERVRKAWQIEPDKIELGGGPVWDDMLQSLVCKACHELGISSDRVERLQVKANLYKFLLYEVGGHFTPHRDTEKEKGMFGTLVVQLPSRFTGGSMTVNHGGETKTFELAQDSEEQYKYIAFYADCQHQLHPVTSGVRICLVYNLVATASQSKDASMSHASNNIATESKLRELVQDWRANPNGIERLGYHLTHKYTPESFGIGSLKGRDDIVFQTLMAAKTKLGGSALFQIHLLMMERYTTKDPYDDEQSGEDYVSNKLVLDARGQELRRSYDSHWKMYKHSDGWLVTKEHFKRLNGIDDADGKKSRRIEDLVCSDQDSDEDEVDNHGVRHNKKIHTMFRGVSPEVNHVEDTGNEGAHDELWYYASAIVLSPNTEPNN